MLAEANVTVVRDVIGIAHATVCRGILQSVVTHSGVELQASVWVDGSYEGDLAYAAGADMTWGREAASQYNETSAGRLGESLKYNVDPFWPDGSVIPHVSDAPMVPIGSADKRIEVYDFRLCITNSPGNHVPFTKPPGYNASEWEMWRRLYDNGKKPPKSLHDTGLGCLGPIPNNYSDCGDKPCVKCDMLGMVHATDMMNGAWLYPNGTTQERQMIRQAHINYTLGLLWFWATDPSTGDALHEEMSQIGFCKDEYADSTPPYFPYQLYVREARRLIGDFVWTEHVPPEPLRQRTVGLGAYTFDCHWVSLYVARPTGQPAYVAAEGRVNNGREGSHGLGVHQPPYVVPYDALLPKRSQLTNVLVPVACSATHIRINAVRMEPAWMIQGHAAGTAAALAAANQTKVQDINVSELQKALLVQKQKIHP